MKPIKIYYADGWGKNFKRESKIAHTEKECFDILKWLSDNNKVITSMKTIKKN